MVRLRNTSPFYLAEGVDLGDYRARVRLRRAARRVAKRGLAVRPRIITREEFLKLIPAPDKVFLAAAKRAVINAGLSEEVV
jgi:hypothetical protein